MTHPSADILVTNGIVLTMDAQNTRYDPGAVAVKGNAITAVGPMAAFDDWHVRRVIDTGGGIIMPGLVNTHTHAAMTCFRGLADDLPLQQWLEDHIFPAESRLDQNMVYKGTLLACAEMILSGTTCFCDMYLFENSVALAAADAGIRAVVGEVLYDFDSPNYGPIESGFAYTEMLAEKWKDHPLINIAVEPHSPYLCAPDLLRRSADIADTHDLPLVIHLSETASEVERIQKQHGCSPVALLERHQILGPNVLACHCVALSHDDIRLLQQYDVKVSHNPESNLKLSSGIAPVPDLLAAGICVGLGTDGCASNNNLDLFGEMDTAAKLHKVNTGDPTVLNAETVLRMATIEGAIALGMGSTIGSLEPGKLADIIVIDPHQPHLTPMYDPASHLVYAANGADVVTTIINGTIVMEARQLKTIELESLLADINQIAAGIRGD